MFVFRNLLRRRLRSALALGGIAVGVASYVALVSISDGFLVTLGRLASLGQPDLVVQSAGVVDPILSNLDDEVVAALEADPRLAEVDSYTTQVTRQERQPFFLVFGLAPRGASLRSCRIVEGTEPGSDPREVLLGKLASERLGLHVGDTLQAVGGALRISGVFEASNPLLAGSAVVDRDRHHALFPDRPRVQLAFLHLAEGVDRTAFQRAYETLHPELACLEPGTFSDAYPQLEMGRNLARVIAWIAALAGAIGVLNTMMMNVLERTREIGTLLAVGWTRARVLRLILGEGLGLAIAGGALGLAIGAGAAEFTIDALDWALVTTRYRVATFLEGAGMALALGVLGAALPAWRAARLSPTEALRYE